MAEHSNGEHRAFESSTGSMDGCKITASTELGSKSPGRSKKYKKVSIFKKSAHDEGSSSKGSGRGKRKANKEKKSEAVEVQDVMEQTTVLPEIAAASPVQRLTHHHSDSEVHHYEIHTQDHEEKSTGDLSVKQFQKLSKELAKQKKSVDALKRDRENLINEKVKLKNENKALKKTGSKSDLLRMSRKQSVDDSLATADEMRLRIKELEDQLAERDYKITVLRLTLEKNSDHALISDSIDLDLDKPTPSSRTTNGGIVDSTTALERLLEEQDTSLKLRKENAELRSYILAMDAEWEKSHKDNDPSPRSPRKRSSGFFKRGKKSTSSMPSRRVSEDAAHDGARKRSQSPDLGKSDSQHEDTSVSPLLSRFNKESTSSLPYYGSPNQSPQMALKNTSSDLSTLQGCLKLALSEKNSFEEKSASLQKEMDSLQEKLKEVEKDSEVKMKEAVTKVQRSLQATEIDRDTYREELKISQQELDDMLEKQRSMEKCHLEALKAKDNRITELEKKVDSFQSTQRSYSVGYSSTSGVKPAPLASPRDSVFSPTKVSKENTSSTPQTITSPTFQAISGPTTQTVSSPTMQTISSPTTQTISSPAAQTISSPTRAKDISSPTKFAGSSSPSPTKFFGVTSPTRVSKDYSNPTRPSHPPSPTKPTSESKSTISSNSASSNASSNVSDPQKQSGKVRRLSKELSTEKPLGPPASSSTRKVGKLSRESSIDRFETPKESASSATTPVTTTTTTATSSAATKRKNSGGGIPTSSTAPSFTKVAGMRAMFEQKIDQTKISNSQLRRPLKSGEGDDKRRLSLGGGTTITSESKPKATPSHFKSNSYDLSMKPSPTSKVPGTLIEKVPEVVSDMVDSQSNPVPPTSDKSKPNGPTSVTNDKTRTDIVYRQQHEKRFSSVSVVSSSSTVSNKLPESVFSTSTARVSSPTKVSKITITSTASPTSSPLPVTKRDMAARGTPGSALLVKNPTSPSLGNRSPSPTSSSGKKLLCNQLSSPGKMALPMRRPSPTKTQEAEGTTSISERSSGNHSALTRSQTQIKVQSSASSWNKQDRVSSSVSVSTSRSSGVSTSSTVTTRPNTVFSTSNQSTASSTFSAARTSVQKNSEAALDSKLTSPVAKMGSLQNIHSQVNGTEDGNTSSSGSNATPQSMTNVSSSTTVVTTSSGARRGPTHRAIQRRDRKDRPKTMYAGRAETTNLVNLISRFQQEEREKKLMKEPVSSGNTSTFSSKFAMGSQPSLAANKPAGIDNSSLSSSMVVTSSNVTMRQHSPNINKPRPATFYIGDSNPSSKSESIGSSKPAPHERKLMRSQTTYGMGMGNNRMSKKAMLLRWCQLMTQNYENVNISNFAESFSNGLAFCALMHHFIPDQVPFSSLSPTTREKNFKIAFKAAEGAGIPSLLDVEDMVSLPIPDWMSVMTYVSFIYNKFGQESQQQQQNQSSMV